MAAPTKATSPKKRGRKKTPSKKLNGLLEHTDYGLWARIDGIEIEDGFNVREDTIPEKELVHSIKEHGVLNPIHVRFLDEKEGKLYLVDGERRYRAALKAGLKKVPVVCEGHMDDKTATIVSLSTNENQKPLTQREKAAGFVRLRDTCGLKPEHIAGVMGYSKREVLETLRVLDKAVPRVRQAAMKSAKEGGIPTRVASRAANLPRTEQRKVVPKIRGKSTAEGLKQIREVEKQLGVTKRGPKASTFQWAGDAKKRCQQLEECVRFKLKHNPKNRTLLGQLDLILVLKGDKEVLDIFPDTKKKKP